MARKLCKRDNRYMAKLVTGKRAPCAFCLREVDDEITFGKLYAIGDIQCHYFCCLLSCCLIQKGHDDQGLFGFMYTDILAEVERCKKHKCSYCSRNGANLGCSVGVCRKQFHLPCGREKNAISLYYGTYKSFCQLHAPRQKIPEHIMAKAKLRLKANRAKVKNIREIDNSRSKTTTIAAGGQNTEGEQTEEMVCVICYEAVDGFPTIHTFWPPCCAKDAWFHRSCLQRMALSAGMHYLKCPLCNDKENFYEAVVSQGYYVPDRDAAWELEQNAFAEIYERPVSCCAETCLCPKGREHDAENGKWDIKLCLLCGSAGAHAHCITDQTMSPTRASLGQSRTEVKTPDQSQETKEVTLSLGSQKANGDTLSLDQLKALSLDQSNALSLDQSNALSLDQSNALTLDQSNALSLDQSNALSLRYVCQSCLPAAPEDLNALASSIEALIQQEQAQTVSSARRPVMPSRMSLRRTKGRLALLNAPSSSRSYNHMKTENESSDSSNVQASRQELNLKTPRKPSHTDWTISREAETKLLSPVKLLEQSFKEKVVCTGVRDAVLDESVIETLRRKFRKPRPLCEKKRIVNDILDGIFDNLMKDAQKQKEQVKEWCSPKKSYNAIEDSIVQTESSQSAKSLEKYVDKENDSNTTNTPANDLNQKEAKIEETLANKYTKNNRKLSEAIHNDCDKSYEVKPTAYIEETPAENVIENCANTRNKANINTVINDRKNSFDNDKRNAVSLTEEHIEETLTKNATENCRNPSIFVSKTVDDAGNLAVNTPKHKTWNTSEDEQINKPTTYKQPPLTIVIKNKSLSLNKSNQKLKIIGKSSEDRLPDKHLQITGEVEKTENICNDGTPIKSITKPSVSKQDENDLRKFITEKDLCSQLLLELTTGKINDKDLVNKSSKYLESTNATVQTPYSMNDTPNSFVEYSMNLIDSPTKSIETQKRKTIDIQQDSSLEISENNQSININVIKIDDTATNNDAYKHLNIKIPDKTKTCSFKFSPLDKETLGNNNVGIDVECFKKEYLNEVDREFTCKFRHKHVDKTVDVPQLRSAINFAEDAAVKKETDMFNCNSDINRNNKKRKWSENSVRLLFDDNIVKKRKVSESDLNLSLNLAENNESENNNIVDTMSVIDTKVKKKRTNKRKKNKTKHKRKEKKNKRTTSDKNVEVTIDSSEKRSSKNNKLKKKLKTKFAIQNQNIHVKIKWKKKQVSLNIESKMQAKKGERKENHSKLKQYVLRFPEDSSKDVLVKPDKAIFPKKRKYVRHEKSPDKLKQTSIQNFFKLKSPEK